MNTLTEIHKNTLIQDVQQSESISPQMKTYYVSLIERAAEATNGVSQEEKLQACSELTFAMLCIMLQDKVKGEQGKTKFQTVASTIERCKSQITIIVLGALSLFYFHPEIVSVLSKWFE